MGGPSSRITGVLKGEMWTQTYTQGELHVNMKAEVAVVHPPSREHERLQKPPEARRGAWATLPHSFRRYQPCRRLALELLASRAVRR